LNNLGKFSFFNHNIRQTIFWMAIENPHLIFYARGVLPDKIPPPIITYNNNRKTL